LNQSWVHNITLLHFEYFNNVTKALTPFTTSYVKTVSSGAKAPKDGS
jgi:hypothetical protein